MKSLLIITLSLVSVVALEAQNYNGNEEIYNCFTIIAGKGTTADGSVLMAHNEDDGGEQMLNMYVVPENVTKGRAKYIWGEFPGMEAADLFMNQYGVAIACSAISSGDLKSLAKISGVGKR